MKTKHLENLLRVAEAKGTVEELCAAYLTYVLEENGGNRAKTADILKIDRRTVQRWIKRAGIKVAAPSAGRPAKEAP